MFPVIVLTICAGWCLASVTVGILIAGAIERRDADLGCGDGIRPTIPSATTVDLAPAADLAHL